jgi:hypothetical protein
VAAGALYSSAQISKPADKSRLELPFGPLTRLPSPDGSYVLVGETRKTSLPEGCTECFDVSTKLFLDNRLTGARDLVLDITGSALAGWSSNGRSFYVQDRMATDSSRVYVFETSSLKKLGVADPILESDAAARPFLRGHAYFTFERWMNSENMVIAFQGHTDDAPVMCFEMLYLVSLAGKTQKLSQRTGPPTAAGCF